MKNPFRWTKNKSKKLADKTAAKIKKLKAKSQYKTAREATDIAKTKERNRTQRSLARTAAYSSGKMADAEVAKVQANKQNDITDQINKLINASAEVQKSQGDQEYTNSDFNNGSNSSPRR